MQYHIKLSDGQAGRYAILTGDPGRVEKIASLLENPRPLSSNREFVMWTGELDGEQVTVASTGIGGPSAAICMEELHAIGVDTFIRAGSCGVIRSDLVSVSDLVVATGAVRGGGTASAYVPPEYPAVATPEVVQALMSAARDLGVTPKAGIVHCKDAFYMEDPARVPMTRQVEAEWATWRAARVLVTEMESDTLFVLGGILGCRVGTVLLAIGDVFVEDAFSKLEITSADLQRLMACAVEGMRGLVRGDRG